MATEKPGQLIERSYRDAADEYLRNLPPEHFMEATAQAMQRKITLESLDLVHARRPEVQVFNELLVQYPRKGKSRPGQVVPDNMVVICKEPIEADGSYDIPLQPVKPFWVLEYVSNSSKRKDYDDNFDHYDKALKIPYYLIFYPDAQDLTLYHHNGKRYVSVVPDEAGLHAIPELEMEVGLHEGWVRYWLRGEMLPLPADMLEELNALRAQLAKETRRADDAVQNADVEKRRADDEKRNAEEERRRADDEKRNAEEERRRADDEKRNAEEERRRADDEKRNAEEERRRADDEKRNAEEERRRADDEKRNANFARQQAEQFERIIHKDRENFAAMEKELAELRATLAVQAKKSTS